MTGVPTRPLRVMVVAGGEPWPLDHGGRLQLYHVLRELSQRARVTLVVPEAPRWREHYPWLEVVQLPPASGEHRSPGSGLVRRAQRHLGCHASWAAWFRDHLTPAHCDVALFSGPQTIVYFEESGVPVVWNAVDELTLASLAVLPRTAVTRWPGYIGSCLLYAALQRHVARRVAATVFVSSHDAARARWLASAAPITVIENGVDLDYFAPAAAPGEPGVVAFIGSLDFAPNIEGIDWFTRRVWPTVHAGDDRRRLLIVGRAPTARVRALRQVSGVELHADVPDVRPFLHRAAVVVAPDLSGSGVKNKVLEACAVGRPVVLSARALGGLSARSRKEVVVAHGVREWVAALETLFDEPAVAARLSRAARAWVALRHGWSRAGVKFYNVLRSAAGWGASVPAPVSNASSVPADAAHEEETLPCR